MWTLSILVRKIFGQLPHKHILTRPKKYIKLFKNNNILTIK